MDGGKEGRGEGEEAGEKSARRPVKGSSKTSLKVRKPRGVVCRTGGIGIRCDGR